MQEIRQQAKVIYNYHQLNQSIEHVNCILALGNSDLRTAQRAAELFQLDYAEWIVASGGLGRLTAAVWGEPEAKKFAEIFVQAGVPEEKILIEDQSSNTFDNFRFSRRLLTKRNLAANSFLIVTKPYMERRAYAMAVKAWPDKKITVTSPQLSFEEYVNQNISEKLLINMVVGDLQRLIVYGENGELAAQPIPHTVKQAYETLVTEGYDEQLIKN